MDEKPFLSDLSLDALQGLINAVCRLKDAGEDIAHGGLTPRFSLVPGLRPTMWIENFTMPEIWRPATEGELADFAALQQASSVGPDLSAMLAAEKVAFSDVQFVVTSDDLTDITDDLSEFPAPAPQEAEPGIGGEGLAVALPADPPPADPVPMAGPLGIGLAPAPTRYPGMVEPVADPLPAGAFVDNAPDQPAPASPPGSASAMAAAAKALAWSEDEDALAVKIYAASIQAGLSITAAGRKVSEALGRPLPGTSHRLRNKLTDPIKAELERLKPKLEHIDAPAEAHPIDPRLRRHLSAMSSITHGKRWKEDEDLTLLEAAVNGLKVGEIAADMGLDTGKVKHRLETLCGSFTPGDVLQGLRQNAGQS